MGTFTMAGTRAIACALAMAMLGASGAAQIIINEIHCDPTGASPPLAGNIIELWNQSATPVYLPSWQVGLWSGDTGAVTTKVIPGFSGGFIYGNCFFVIESQQITAPNTTFLNDPNLPAGVRGIALGYAYTWPWTPASDIGCWLKNPAGVCQDYVYLRRGTTAAPPVAPNLPAGATWVTGNVGAAATGAAHLQRLTNVNHQSHLDWEQTASAAAASWGSPNTTGAATQGPVGPCVPAVQPNQPQSALTISSAGVNASSFSTCAAATVDVSFASTNIGLPYDVGVAPSPPVTPASGSFTITAGGQMVNVDLANPSFYFLLGGTLGTPFPGNFTQRFGVSVALTISAQQVVVEPTFADGFALSQAVSDVFTALAPTYAGPTGHGQAVSVPLLALPNALVCGVQDLAFFGIPNQVGIFTTSGRFTFGNSVLGFPANALSYTPSVSVAATDGPMVGVWSDLTVTSSTIGAAGACWMQGVAPGILRFNYTQVSYTANPSVHCTFGIQFDTNTGIVQLDGLGGIGNPGGNVSQFIGISAGGLNNGGLGANNFGPATFSPGFYAGPQAHAMIYAFGQAGTLTPGVTMIQFIPNATGDYDYFVF